jgi:hypothetical protein
MDRRGEDMNKSIAARRLRRRPALAAAAVALAAPAGVASAQVGAYPDPYDPARLLTFNIVMDAADWETVRFDLTYDIEVPAMFWAAEEPPILVSVRRKSADGLPSELDPRKISMKVDINEYVGDQVWHGVKKLSLENGDDVNVVTEGFAWYLHRLAAGFAGSSYAPGLAAWARVIVNGQDLGVYLNVEQPDKQFMKNRDLYTSGGTWLYKQDGVDYVELKVGDPDSPSYLTMCYSPFRVGSAEACPLPADDVFVDDLNALIDMQAMLAHGAVNAFTYGPDSLFSKGKNFYFADFLDGTPRMHFPWDLDSAFGNLRTDRSIYDRGTGPGRAYEDQIIDVPAWRPQYDQTMAALLAGPLEESVLIAFLDQAEATIGPALAADPNNQIGEGVGGYFDQLRSWVTARTADVLGQLPAGPPTGACCVGTVCGLATADECAAQGGTYLGDLTFCAGDACAGCPGDANGDGTVDVDDMLGVLAAWGTADPVHDLDGSGDVGVEDLLIVLGAWGVCGG